MPALSATLPFGITVFLTIVFLAMLWRFWGKICEFLFNIFRGFMAKLHQYRRSLKKHRSDRSA
jgi:hypothetical protein